MPIIKKLTDKEIDERIAAVMQVGQILPEQSDPRQVLNTVLGFNETELPETINNV